MRLIIRELQIRGRGRDWVYKIDCFGSLAESFCSWNVIILLTSFCNGDVTRDDLQQRFFGHQCWNNVATIRNNVAKMLQRFVVQESSHVTSP